MRNGKYQVEARRYRKIIISNANFHYINQGEYVHRNDFQDLRKSITSLTPL